MLSSITVIFNTVGPQNINSPRYHNMSQTACTEAPNSSLILMIFLMVVLKLLWLNHCHSTFNHYQSSKTQFHNIHFTVMSTHHFIKCVVSPWSFPTKTLQARQSAIIPTIHLEIIVSRYIFIIVGEIKILYWFHSQSTTFSLYLLYVITNHPAYLCGFTLSYNISGRYVLTSRLCCQLTAWPVDKQPLKLNIYKES
jgi:hypothetical protein